MKVDCQGFDLDVLESSKSKVSVIKSLVMEFPYDSKSSLYEQENSLHEGYMRAHELGFRLARVVPNGAGEANIFLYNHKISLLEYFQIEDKLELFNCPTLKLKSAYQPRSRVMKRLFTSLALLENKLRT